jgi:hypothetical protein
MAARVQGDLFREVELEGVRTLGRQQVAHLVTPPADGLRVREIDEVAMVQVGGDGEFPRRPPQQQVPFGKVRGQRRAAQNEGVEPQAHADAAGAEAIRPTGGEATPVDLPRAGELTEHVASQPGVHMDDRHGTLRAALVVEDAVDLGFGEIGGPAHPRPVGPLRPTGHPPGSRGVFPEDVGGGTAVGDGVERGVQAQEARYPGAAEVGVHRCPRGEGEPPPSG